MAEPSASVAGSLVKPRRGAALEYFAHLASGARKAAKFGSKLRVYNRLCLQLSNEPIDSVLVRHHCLGAR